jgi:hypothetical protein
MRLKLNGTHQHLSYADDVNLFGDYISRIKNIGTVINAGREVGLEINVEKNKYMLSPHQIADQNWNIKISNISLENVSHFR